MAVIKSEIQTHRGVNEKKLGKRISRHGDAENGNATQNFAHPPE